jgi:Na+/H+-dicarboxylate symporter
MLPKNLALENIAGPTRPALTGTSVPERIVELFPKNPLSAMLDYQMLQLVIFAVIVGIALVSLPPRDAKPLLELLGSLQKVCMAVVRWAMTLAPVAVFGLMAQLTASVGLEVLAGLSVYVGTVLAGLLVLLTVYLGALVLMTGSSPVTVLRNLREVQLLAFSTSSSAAVMPLTVKTAEEGLGVRPSVAQLVIPLGATVNMNGTALYQGIAAVFLAQVFGVELTASSMLLLVVTAVAASVGSPATPGVGIVILAMVLTTVGVPASGIALIMGVDRILDMSRTAVNVTGDVVAASVLDSLVGGPRTAAEEVAAEEELEAERVATGEDVLLGSEA